MSTPYGTFGSHILFKEIRHDVLGHFYRAAEFSAKGLGRMVWLRVLDGEAVPRDDVRGAFDTARKVGDILKAANVVAKPSFPVVGGVPALACDHIPSQPLDSLFDKVHTEGFPVPVDNALLILEKLALGLSAALAVDVSGSSLVHGFLHPGLILVTNDGEGLIMGFGVADQLLGMLDDKAAAAKIQPYLAPEVLVSRNPSKRGDVYSLGAILYQLLTGHPLPVAPEDRQGVLDDAELAYDGEPLPADIKALLARALSAKVDDRYSSAADFKKELDKLLYGGAYSPTTFNLALFMDRLFRTEIEEDEKDRAQENAIDVAPYLAPEPEPEPEAIEPVSSTAKASSGGRGPLIGIAIAAVVVAAVALFMLNRQPPAPAVPPTPTAEEVEAQRLAEEQRLQDMIQGLVQQRMAEKEEEIRAELGARQTQIEELRKRLQESEKRSQKGQLSAEEQAQQKQIQREIAAAEEEQRQQEEALEAERQRVAAQERERLAAQHAAATATAAAQAEADRVAALAPSATPPPSVKDPSPATATAVPPTKEAAPAAASTDSAPTEVAITENMFLPVSAVDSLPVILKEEVVSWPRVAIQSHRKGIVIVQATVNSSGVVEDAKILRADDDGFGIREAVLKAVREYRFKPATKNGIRVKTYFTVTKRYAFRER